jgi:hypothetical protein
MEKLHEVRFRGFSPTALGSYLACSLLVCYSHVLGNRESEEPEESIDAATSEKLCIRFAGCLYSVSWERSHSGGS